jgi:SAM-dependent methyltransferase
MMSSHLMAVSGSFSSGTHTATLPNPSDRKQLIRTVFDEIAKERARWRQKAAFFHLEDDRYLKFLIPPGSKILEIGCGIGDTLAELQPSVGVGIDISPAMVAQARQRYPHLSFHIADAETDGELANIQRQFDFILVVDTIGFLDDCQAFLEKLHPFCNRQTRIIIAYYSHLWWPFLKLAENVGLRARQPPDNVLSGSDLCNIAKLADMDVVTSSARLLLPVRAFGLGRLINRFVSSLPLISNLALRHYTVCRSLRADPETPRSATVVIPARNEEANIAVAVKRLPRFCDDIEVIFVEGHSKDRTYLEMQRVQAAHPEWDIKVMRQPGKGKADAVFAAFEVARGDVLMILDADLTMPPEQLPKFWEILRQNKAEFANGSRLIYPMENEAMRFLNLVANKIFSYLFSWLLGQRVTDTLCGTKVLRSNDYKRIQAGRGYFGDFDPFGDFDLLFGAVKLKLKSVDVPIRYAARSYGETQISRFRHGLLLLQMVWFALLRIKAL